MSDRKIILSEDDFNEPAATTQYQAAGGPTLPPVSPRNPVGISPGATGAWSPQYAKTSKAGAGTNPLVDSRTSWLIAAALGVLLAWAITQIFNVAGGPLFFSKAAADRAAALYVAVVALTYGSLLMAFDRMVAGAWEAVGRRVLVGAVPLFAIGYGSGYGASALYQQLMNGVFSVNDIRGYGARAAGWAIFGLGIGITIGLIDKSRARTINGAIGGAIGGAAGGLLFQAVAANVSTSVSFARLIGLAGIGLCIGLATRAVEAARKEAWVHIVAGGMTGKEFILWHTITRVGSSPDCEIYLLKDTAVAKLHAQIEDHNGRRLLRSIQDASVLVNGAPVATHWLRSTDQVQIGSTLLAYSERALVPAAPGAFSGVR